MSTPAQWCARMAAAAMDKLLQIGVPMDPGVTAQVDRYRRADTADLLNQAAALIAAMAPGSPHAESAAFLVPQLQCRAEALSAAPTLDMTSNLAAAQAMFPQHTR